VAPNPNRESLFGKCLKQNQGANKFAWACNTPHILLLNQLHAVSTPGGRIFLVGNCAQCGFFLMLCSSYDDLLLSVGNCRCKVGLMMIEHTAQHILDEDQ